MPYERNSVRLPPPSPPTKQIQTANPEMTVLCGIMYDQGVVIVVCKRYYQTCLRPASLLKPNRFAEQASYFLCELVLP